MSLTRATPPRLWLAPALAGLLAMLALIGLQEALNSLNQVVPSAPSAAAQTIVRLTPGSLTTAMIELLGPWAMRLLIASAYLVTALSGLLLGAVAGHLASHGRYSWGIVFLISVPFLLYLLVSATALRVPGILALVVIAGLFYALLYAGLVLLLWNAFGPVGPNGRTVDNAVDIQRRGLLGGGLVGVALLGGGVALRQAARSQGVAEVLPPLAPQASPAPTATQAVVAQATHLPITPTQATIAHATNVVASPPQAVTARATNPVTGPTPSPVAPTAIAARPATAAPADQRVAPPVTPVPNPEQREEDQFFGSIAGLTPEVTPLQNFYIVDEAVDDPRVTISQWQLTVRGHVERPLTLGYDQVRALPAVDQYATLMCISYEPGDDLLGNAKWRGVRLADLLKQAGVKEGATEVVLRSVDNFDESFPIAKALEPTTLLAYAMDEMSLPIEHGSPLRALVPGHYGYKNVKWLTDIEVITGTHQGYWERKADWDQKGLLASATSRIDVIDSPPIKAGQAVNVGGIAFAGPRGISKVELSADGGMTWLPARLKRALSPLSWRLWGVQWTPTQLGKARVLVRAYEADGRPQVQERYPSHPSGATGLHSVEVEVSE